MEGQTFNAVCPELPQGHSCAFILLFSKRGNQMGTDIHDIDPQWAWARFQADAQRPWSRRLAAHLFRRAGFCATSQELDHAVKLGPAGAIDRLFDPPAPSTEFQASSGLLADRTADGGDAQQLSAWWLYRMLNTADPLLEKLTLFWHGHFATSAVKVQKLRMMLDQNELLRSHACDKFEEMVRAVSRDPAMLVYLDSTTNRRIRPNENYARELMELFTLGVGNYTEADIKEVARAFTGYEVRGDTFRFDAGQHDTGAKAFLGRTGNFDGDAAVRVVLDQPAAPRFIARKLIRFFAFDEPAVAPDALVEPIATELREHDFRIDVAVRRILASNVFFSGHAIARKVRSPVELCVGLMRALGGTTNLVRLARGSADLGQALFEPPNVKGWDGGRTWINSSTLLGRANLVGQVLSEPETRFGASGKGLADVAEQAGASTPEAVVDWLLELLVASPVPAAAREALIKLASVGEAGDESRALANVIHVMSALPEFQLA
jgi:uncharacterized protein (DUF1800 family)